jgi:hypothetical protein
MRNSPKWIPSLTPGAGTQGRVFAFVPRTQQSGVPQWGSVLLASLPEPREKGLGLSDDAPSRAGPGPAALRHLGFANAYRDARVDRPRRWR